MGFKTIALATTALIISTNANAALLLNPDGPGYETFERCSGCFGSTILDVTILNNNTPIVLDFDPRGAFHESFDLVFINPTGADWTSFSIEYVANDTRHAVQAWFDSITPDTDPQFTATQIINPYTGYRVGEDIAFATPEPSGLRIRGNAARDGHTAFETYSIVIQANTVPVPAAVWLFGSGLIGLIGVARRKVRV